MERVGDCTAEDGKCLAVQGLQCTGRKIHRQFAAHVQILVKNELDLGILLTIALDHAGTGVDLCFAAAADGKIQIHTAPCGGRFLNIILGEDTQIAGADQLFVGRSLQLQCLPGEEIDIAQPHPLKIGRLIELIKAARGLSSLPAKSSQQV